VPQGRVDLINRAAAAAAAVAPAAAAASRGGGGGTPAAAAEPREADEAAVGRAAMAGADLAAVVGRWEAPVAHAAAELEVALRGL
jgi:hypothetical protein